MKYQYSFRIMNSLQQNSLSTNTIILGIHNYLPEIQMPTHLKILIIGAPMRIQKNVLWNEVYQKTILRQIYQKFICWDCKKQAIFLRINGGDPLPLQKYLLWKNKCQLNKNTQNKSMTILIEGFLKSGQNRKITIDIVKSSKTSNLNLKGYQQYHIIYNYIEEKLNDTLNNKSTHLYNSSQFKSDKQNFCSKLSHNKSKETIFIEPLKQTNTQKKSKTTQKHKHRYNLTQYKKNTVFKNKQQTSIKRKQQSSNKKDSKFEQILNRQNPQNRLSMSNNGSHSNNFSNWNQQKLKLFNDLNFDSRPISSITNMQDQVNQQFKTQKGVINTRQSILSHLIYGKSNKITELQNQNKQLSQKVHTITYNLNQKHQKQLQSLKEQIELILQSNTQKINNFKAENQNLRNYVKRIQQQNNKLIAQLSEQKQISNKKDQAIQKHQLALQKQKEQFNREKQQFYSIIQTQKKKYERVIYKMKQIQMEEQFNNQSINNF